jgi:hypothetical protein
MSVALEKTTTTNKKTPPVTTATSVNFAIQSHENIGYTNGASMGRY